MKAFFVIVDQVSAELEKRGITYRVMDIKFGFLSRLTSPSNDDTHQAASWLTREYPDFEDTFPFDTLHFAGFFLVKAAAVAREKPILELNKLCIQNSIKLKIFLLLNENTGQRIFWCLRC